MGVARKGVYNLLIRLEKDCRLKVGMIGTFQFPKGYYVYTGSAQNNMEKRIARHLSHNKKMHWHIDYLLRVAKVLKVVEYAGLKADECRISRAIGKRPDAKIIVTGFGSSDCMCRTHLFFFPEKSKNLLQCSSLFLKM
ncbi:MAG TPA: GIY-YIG nuclease family protein [Candidatus Brocadiales bacterium]|nr:GIY-YIG nuclease family protein [Candidatus Brocadiales bacterium]